MSSPTTPSRSGDLSELLINVDRDLKLGVKRATSILDAIEATRSLTLSQFLGSLGLDHLGKRRVELMINAADGALDDLEAWRCGSLRDASFAAAAGVPSIGSEIQDGIDSMAVVIDKLLKAGVTVKSLNEEGGATLAKTICISGKLYSGYKKSDYLLPLRKIGYALVDEVTKGLNFLVLADIDSGSSKAEKAKKLGVSVISESQLIDMISLIASAPPDSLLESSLLRVNEPKPPMEIAMSNATKPLVSDSASRRFEFVDEKSSKFWEVKVVSGSVEVRFGKIGTNGQDQIKKFDSPAEALKHAEKLVHEKLKGGYQEIGQSSGRQHGQVASASVVAPTPVKKVAKSAPVKSLEAPKKVCISGKLPSGSKKSDYEVPLNSAGYSLVDDVVHDLTYLVLADPSSTNSKAEKARKLGVEVISEERLIELIG